MDHLDLSFREKGIDLATSRAGPTISKSHWKKYLHCAIKLLYVREREGKCTIHAFVYEHTYTNVDQ